MQDETGAARCDNRGAAAADAVDRVSHGRQLQRGRGHRAGGLRAPARGGRASSRRRRGSRTVVTRLAIDHLRSARVRREQYTGTWLPEPVLADPAPDAAVRAESLSLAVLVLLESLTPVERAVFVLREAFDYGYDEIAEIVGQERGQLPPARRPRAPARRRGPAALRALARAARRADAPLRRRPAGGRDRAAGRAAGRRRRVLRRRRRQGAVRRRSGSVPTRWRACSRASAASGAAAAPRPSRSRSTAARGCSCARATGSIGVWALEISDGVIQTILGVVNPDKLAHISSTTLPSLPPALKRS